MVATYFNHSMCDILRQVTVLSVNRDKTTCATTKTCAYVFAHSTEECFYGGSANVFGPNSRPRVNNVFQAGQGISSKVYEAGFPLRRKTRRAPDNAPARARTSKVRFSHQCVTAATLGSKVLCSTALGVLTSSASPGSPGTDFWHSLFGWWIIRTQASRSASQANMATHPSTHRPYSSTCAAPAPADL